MAKQKWIKKAQKRIGYGDGKKPKSVVEMNRNITAQYAKMYCKDPSFKWAGMAAFASKLVGDGIRQAEALHQSGLPWIPGVSDINGRELAQCLAAGNILVYADIFWQHLAFCEGGLAALEACHQAGEIPDRVIEAWRKINRSKEENNADLCWEGNTELLRYEQEIILQNGIYTPKRDFWGTLSDRSDLLENFGLPLLESPIPGDDDNFHDAVDNGDVGNFEHRWQWIAEKMLPAYRRLVIDSPERTNQLLRQLAGKSPLTGGDSNVGSSDKPDEDATTECAGKECQIIKQEAQNGRLTGVKFSDECSPDMVGALQEQATSKIIVNATRLHDTCPKSGKCRCVALKDAESTQTEWGPVRVEPFELTDDDCTFEVRSATVETRIVSTPGLCKPTNVEVSSVKKIGQGLELASLDAEFLAVVETDCIKKMLS